MRTRIAMGIGAVLSACADVSGELASSAAGDPACPTAASGPAFWREWASVEGTMVAAAAVRGCDAVVVTVGPTGTPSLLRWSPSAATFHEPIPLPGLGDIGLIEGVVPVTADAPRASSALPMALDPQGGGALCLGSKVVVFSAGALGVEAYEIPGAEARCRALGFDARGALLVSYSASGAEGLPIPWLARLEGAGTWTKVGLPEYWSAAATWIATDAGGRTYAGGPSLTLHVGRLESVGGGDEELLELELASVPRRASALGLCPGGQVLLDLARTDSTDGFGCVDPDTGAVVAVPAPATEGGSLLVDPVVDSRGEISVLRENGPPPLQGRGRTESQLLAFDPREGAWWAPAGEETLVSPSGWGLPRLLGIDGEGRPVALAEGRLWVGRALR